MKRTCERKHLWVPAQVEHIEKFDQRIIIDPKNTIIHMTGQLGIVVENTLQFLSPIFNVKLRVIAFPPQMRPRIFELKQTLIINISYIQNGICMCGNQASSFFFLLGQMSSGKCDEHVASVDPLKHALKVAVFLEARVLAMY